MYNIISNEFRHICFKCMQKRKQSKIRCLRKMIEIIIQGTWKRASYERSKKRITYRKTCGKNSTPTNITYLIT